MNAVYLKTGVSILEILAGLICIGISIYYLIEAQYCHPNAEFCRPLAMLPVVVFLIPGVLACSAGTVSITIKRITFWIVQLTMLTLICLYFILFFALVYKLQG
jgi:hypothetical protein